MNTMHRALAVATLGTLAVVAFTATAQEVASYTVVEDRSAYYVAPPITVERRYASEDMLITEDVKAALAADPRLDPRNIAVETSRNVVSLSGLVNTPGQAVIATRDAGQVYGVAEVRNYLRSRVGDPTSY